MIEQIPYMRIATQQPAPVALADYEPFQVLGLGPYCVSEVIHPSNARFQGALALVRQLFKRYPVVGVSPRERVKAVFFDMDATVIKQESLVELAAAAGKSAEVSAVTERAMRGELDFRASLIERVAVLAGLPAEESLSRVVESVILQPGIQDFVAFCRKIGVPCYMVSGGFTAIAEPVARAVGFDGFRANVLGITAGKLTGTVEGPVVDALAKRSYMLEICAQLGVEPNQVAAVGDGANDRMMLESAGVAVGFEPKEVLYPHLMAVTDHHAFLAPLLFGRDLSSLRGRLTTI